MSSMSVGFNCAGCDRDFCWDSELPLVGAVMIKTIGSRYCFGCIDKEMAAHGLSREQVIAMRSRLGRATSPP